MNQKVKKNKVAVHYIFVNSNFVNSFNIILSAIIKKICQFCKFFQRKGFPSNRCTSSECFNRCLDFFLHVVKFCRILQSICQSLSSLVKGGTDNTEHKLFILYFHRWFFITFQTDYRRSNLRTRHKAVRWYICHNIWFRIILHSQRRRARRP